MPPSIKKFKEDSALISADPSRNLKDFKTDSILQERNHFDFQSHLEDDLSQMEAARVLEWIN